MISTSSSREATPSKAYYQKLQFKETNSLIEPPPTSMLEREVKAAFHIITNQDKWGVMLLLDSLVSTNGAVSTDSVVSKTVCDILLEKDPSAKPPVPIAVCVLDDTITWRTSSWPSWSNWCIHNIVLRMDVAAGPSGIDVAGWKQLCTYNFA